MYRIACGGSKTSKICVGERPNLPFLEQRRVKRDATSVPVRQDPPPVIGCQSISSHDRPIQPQIKASLVLRWLALT